MNMFKIGAMLCTSSLVLCLLMQFISFHAVYFATYDQAKDTPSHPSEGRTHRFERHQQRYHYVPPASNNVTGTNELCGAGPNFTTYFNLKFLYRSGNNEDLDIYNLFFKDSFDSKGHGGVIELGAFDGMRESNSRFFEHCLGWDALLIEGNPKTYEKLVSNRPNSHRFNFAPSCSEKEDMADKMVKFDNCPMLNAGLGSVNTVHSVN